MLDPTPTPGKVEAMMKELDTDGNGEVDMWEFCVYYQKERDQREEGQIQWELDEAFRVVLGSRADTDGCISAQVFQRPVPSSPLPLAVSTYRYPLPPSHVSPSAARPVCPEPRA